MFYGRLFYRCALSHLHFYERASRSISSSLERHQNPPLAAAKIQFSDRAQLANTMRPALNLITWRGIGPNLIIRWGRRGAAIHQTALGVPSFLFDAAIAFCAECIMGSRNFRLTHSAPLHCLLRNYSGSELKVWLPDPAARDLGARALVLL